MNDLTPSFEPETGQVIITGPPSGPAGEAALVPVTGVDLAFDRADGHLVRALVENRDRNAVALLTRLFGPQVLVAMFGEQEPAEPDAPVLTVNAGLGAALSSLARLDATRVTSPVPDNSPWWAAEAAVLAKHADLPGRALAEARRAVRDLGCRPTAVPDRVAAAAYAAADIVADQGASRRLRENIMVTRRPHLPDQPELHVAAEVSDLRRPHPYLPGLHWVFDPSLSPSELFQPGLSPHSDLLVHRDDGHGRLMVQANLVPGADCAAVGRYRVRLVDPAERRVLAHAPLKAAVSNRAGAELQLRQPFAALNDAWIEVVMEPDRPVRSSRAHLIRRALRWADAALRAERAPEGLDRHASDRDWAALATLAWARCRDDWAAAGDDARAAAVVDRGTPLPGPACLAEDLGE